MMAIRYVTQPIRTVTVSPGAGGAIDLARLSINIFPGHYRDRLIAVMEAYGDGSQYDGLGHFVVAAFVAPLEEWAQFSPKWRDVLHEADPALTVFHMTDYLARRTKPYREWDDNKHGRLIESLLDLVGQAALFGAGVALKKREYDSLSAGVRQRLGNLADNPYRVCAHACIARISNWLEKHGFGNERVAYVFEAGDKGLPAFRETVNEIIGASQVYRDEMKIISVVNMSKRDALPLQAADILAWEMSHHRGGPFNARLRRVLDHGCAIERVTIGRKGLERFAELATAEKLRSIASEYGVPVSRRQKKRYRRNHSGQ